MSKLQIEVGKSYIARNGKVVKIFNNDNHPRYPFNGDNGHDYIPNGRVFYSRTSYSDLVSEAPSQPKDDAVNHPPHYTSHPSGIECIQVTEHIGSALGTPSNTCGEQT